MKKMIKERSITPTRRVFPSKVNIQKASPVKAQQQSVKYSPVKEVNQVQTGDEKFQNL